MPTLKQTIVPHLWYDKEAKEAAEFYTSIFEDSRITNVTTIHDTPSGDADIVSFELLDGQAFMAINGGPVFTFNEAISLMVKLRQPEGDRLLLGEAHGRRRKADQCGWLKDKFGVSWQVVPADWTR